MVSITVCHLVAGGAYSQQTKGSAQGVQAQDRGDDPQDRGMANFGQGETEMRHQDASRWPRDRGHILDTTTSYMEPEYIPVT